MSKSINQQLEEKIAEFKSLELAKSHLEKLQVRIEDTHKKMGRLQMVLEKEYKDIEQLEKLSMRALFEKVLGDKEAQLKKERQEYLNAALNYNECKKSLELLDFERNILRKKLSNYKETKSELHNLIRNRENSLIKEDKLARQLLTDLNAKIDASIASKRELHEAIAVGLKVKRTIKNIIFNLEKVSSWGTYAFNNPDEHIRKVAHINKAKEQAYLAKQLLQEFEDELSDIYEDQNIDFESSLKTFQYFIHSFFQGLISDWIILTKIQNATNVVHQLDNQLTRITQSLQYDLKKVEKEMELFLDKKEKIILELN